MESGSHRDIIQDSARIVDIAVERHEREAARGLIMDRFRTLPWELQQIYFDYMDAYRAREWDRSFKLWELWKERARELKLI